MQVPNTEQPNPFRAWRFSRPACRLKDGMTENRPTAGGAEQTALKVTGPANGTGLTLPGRVDPQAAQCSSAGPVEACNLIPSPSYTGGMNGNPDQGSLSRPSSPACPVVFPVPEGASRYMLMFDGGCEPNPGQGYGSWKVMTEGEAPICILFKSRVKFGEMTNNQAEYTALIKGLEELFDMAPIRDSLQIFTDSVLVVNQVLGNWRVKNYALIPLRNEVIWRLRHWPNWDIHWHGRENNVTTFGH